MCNNSGLLGTLTLVKRVLLLIQIIVPIILIGSVIISLIKLLHNPAKQNGTKKIINQFIAAVIVFFIPLLVNVVMNIAGDNTNFSSCWNSASDKITLSSGYTKYNEKERKKITYDAKDYEKGLPAQLDFSCTSKIVRSQFSCETLPIIEKHLYDFDATNFNSVINNKYGGSFEKYAKSVGGIFGAYYGKKIEGRTATSFQIAAEYVLGWMYMYGWDSGFIKDHFTNWGQCYNNGGYAPDGFYAHGGWVSGLNWRPFNTWEETRDYRGNPDEKDVNFDDIIAGKLRGGVSGLVVICGDAPNFIYNKLGISKASPTILQISLKDVKVGDQMGIWNDATGKSHVIVVGEVYNDYIIVYDTGGSYICTMNYKRRIDIPAVSSKEADLNAIRKVYGAELAGDWNITRYTNFEED